MPLHRCRHYYKAAKGLFLLLQGLSAPQKRVQMTILIAVCCLSYIVGVMTAPLISPIYLLFFMIFVLFTVSIAKFVFKHKISVILIAVLMFFTGNMRYMFASENALYDKFPDKYVEINGTICSLPGNSVAKHKFRYEVELDNISYLGTTYKTNDKILLHTDSEFAYGDTVSAFGFLTNFSSVLNEYGTDFAKFYKCRGILARLTAFEIEKTGEKTSYMPRFLMGKLSYRIYKNMQSLLPDEDFALSCAALFGDKSYLDRKYQLLTVRTGVARVLYSSFVHISILLLFVSLLSSKKKRREIYFIIAITLYLLLFNSSAIALKVCITAGLVIGVKQLKGFSDKLEILAFAVLLITFYNPLLCFDGGFMMSVICTALLQLSYTPIYKRLSGFRIIRRMHLAAPLTIWSIFIFGAMPFAAYYFNGASVYAFFLVPLLLPFVAIILVTAPLLFIFNGFYTALYPIQLLFHAAITVMRNAPYFVSRLPYYYIFLPTPSVTFIIFYCLLWWVLLRAAKSEFNTPLTKFIVSAAAGMLVCSLIGVSINSLNIYFVNVGQGDAAILHTDIGETVIIDGGGASEQDSYNIGDSVFLPYLASHGFTHIDVAIVSHYHKDHVEGVISAVENLKVNTLVLPDCMPDNVYRQKLETLARDKDIKTEYLHIGDKIRFRSGLELTVIAPGLSLVDKDNENDTSLVIEVRYGDFTALFTGDSETNEELAIPQNIDLLKVSHHGSENGNSKEFIASARPRIAVISVGKNNRHNLPCKDVIADLSDVGAQILRTDQLGDIRIKTDKNGNIKYNSLLGGDQRAAKRE